MKAARVISGLTGLVAAVAVIGVLPANAETVGQYHLPTDGGICIEDHGITRWDDALPNVAGLLRTHGITQAVVQDNCSSYEDRRVITLVTSVDDAAFYCARTERGYYVNGVATGRTTIRANLSTKWFNQCHSTTNQRRHVMAHEVGHALGLVHNSDLDSVMYEGAGNPWLTGYSARDYRDLHKIYDEPGTTRSAYPTRIRPMPVKAGVIK